jgi:hypothetical protein
MVDITHNFTLYAYKMRFVSLRIYREGGIWGKRSLGPGRFALDAGRVSLILENLNSPRRKRLR